MALFSVIVPSYNRADLLPRCLESVLGQTFKDYEVIVVDNYSTDETESIMLHYCRQDNRIHYIREHNGGVVAHSRNFGIHMSRGEYVCFLDSDDWYHQEKLRMTEERIRKDGADLIYNPLRIVSSRGRHAMQGKPMSGKDPYHELLIEGNKIANSSMVVRRRVLEEVGGLSENPLIVGVEDFDLVLRLARRGCKISYIPEVLGCYWVGDNFSASPKQAQSLMHLYEEHLPYVERSLRAQVVRSRDYRRARILHCVHDYSGARQIYRSLFKGANPLLKMKLVVLVILTLMRK